MENHFYWREEELTIRRVNYSTGGMLETTLDVNYSTRGMLETTLDVNYFTRGMLETTLDANYSIGRMLESLRMLTTPLEGCWKLL